MPFNYNANGSLAEFTAGQISVMQIETLGIEELSSPTFTREVNQSIMRAEFLVNSEELDNFCCFMLGGQTVYFDGAKNAISRLMPQTLVYQGVDYGNFAAVKIEEASPHQFVEDDRTSNDYPIPTFEKYRVRVLFQQLPYNLQDDESTTSETERYWQVLPSQGQTEYISLPGGVMHYVPAPGQNSALWPANVPVPYGIGRPVPSIMIAFKWWRLPYDAWGPNATDSNLYTAVYGDQEAGIDPLSGKINTTTFQGYPPGTLLFLTVEEELVMDPMLSTLSWNLTFKFLVKYYGHNWLYAYAAGGPIGNGNGWYFVNGVNTTWYDEADLPDNTSLFNADDFGKLVAV